MFTTLIIQPIFNLLVLIYALLPGHNFGLAIIIFTVIIRLLLWPLVKKQLHHAKAIRALAPELKRIAKQTAGDKKQRAALQMELYKERGINPFGPIGVTLLQLPILLGLYSGLHRVVTDKHQIVSFAYPALQHLPWLQQLSHNIKLFDSSLFGVVDLSWAALGVGGIYWPAMIIVVIAVVTQFFQSKQLLPNTKDGRGLRSILKDAGGGKQADSDELNAAVGQSTKFLLPAMIFLFTVRLASALSLYILVGSLVAFIQQSIVLREDSSDISEVTTQTSKKLTKKSSSIREAEVIATPKIKTPKTETTAVRKTAASGKAGRSRKRRKR